MIEAASVANWRRAMAFEPAEQFRTAVDKNTGARVEVRSAGSSTESRWVRYISPNDKKLEFDLSLKNVSGEPNAIINATYIDRIFRAQGRTDVRENTVLVKYVLQGLAVIDRKWPLMRKTQFGSNYEEYRQKGEKFSFLMPSDEELRALAA